MTVHWEAGSEEGAGDEDLASAVVRRPGKGLGLSEVGRRDGPGAYISALVPGGVAEAGGQLGEAGIVAGSLSHIQFI